MKIYFAGTQVSGTPVFSRAILVTLLLFAVPLHAEPVNYVSLSFSIGQSLDGEEAIDRVTTARLNQSLDLNAQTLSSSVTGAAQSVRLLHLGDPDPSGFGLSGFRIPNTSVSQPTVTSSLTQSGRVLTFERGNPGAPRIVMSPNEDLLVDMTADELPSGATDRAFITSSLAVRSAEALALSDLSGSYAFYLYKTTFSEGSDYTRLQHALEELRVIFAGDGSCTAESSGSISTSLQTDWPDLASRTTPRAFREAIRQADSCSYSVDSSESSATLQLGFLIEGGTEQLTIPFLVSDGARYLVGEQVSTENSGDATTWFNVLITGARVFNAPTNQSLSGVYLLSLLGTTLEGLSDFGTEGAFAARYAIEFSDDVPDSSGYSDCVVLGSTQAGARRTLGGMVPQATGEPYKFSDASSTVSDHCRYRVAPEGSVALEFKQDEGEWQAATLFLADDGATLVGGAAITSGEPLTVGVETALTPTGASTVWSGFAQQANAGPLSSEVVAFSQSYILPIDPAITLAASVLPSSRSVGLGVGATGFATIINAGATDARRCRVLAPEGPAVTVSFQETNPVTNAPVGQENPLVDIPAGESRSFVFTVRSAEALRELELALSFVCVNSNRAATFPGINTLLFSAEAIPSADVIALAATIDQDGIVKLDSETDSGVFSMATVNLGASSDVMVTVDSGDAELGLSLSICQTNPVTAQCINPTVPGTDPVILRVEAGGTPTFGVFVSGTTPIDLDPARNRLFVRVRDPAGVIRGGTSVAVTTGSL